MEYFSEMLLHEPNTALELLVGRVSEKETQIGQGSDRGPLCCELIYKNTTVT